MENFPVILELARILGLPGVILFMWWWDSRKAEERMTRFEQIYRESRQNYLDNVELVKTTQGIARSIQTLAENQQTFI